MTTQPVRIAVIGLGGFAQAHHKAIVKIEESGAGRLVCASGRDPSRYKAFMDELGFAKRKVRVFSNHLEMMDTCRAEIDFVLVPTPIHMHMPMHKEVVDRKLACYLEKPPTLDIRELEQMLEVEKRAVRPTLVGFNMVSDPTRHALKKRLVNGEFGALKRASFLGISPRYTPYYSRNSWAGRIEVDGHLVLDSCIGNAVAHNVHNMFLWAGTTEVLAWADVSEVEAELYRGHAVQNFDTVFSRAKCKNGVEVRIAASHACEMPNRHIEYLECEKASIEWLVGKPPVITWKDGKREEMACDPVGGTIEVCLRSYMDFLQGRAARPLTRLVDTRPFVQLFDLNYLAAGQMHVVKPEHINRTVVNPGEEQVGIKGVTEACERFIKDATFPSRQNLPWAGPGGKATVKDLSRFGAVIDKFRKQY